MEPIILPYGDTVPVIAPDAWIAPGAVVIGDTHVGPGAVVLFGCVIRGDIHTITIGAGTNIQDLSMLHVADGWPCVVGDWVTVGHCAILHGCVVEDACLIGMGARVLNGARVGRGSIVAAGAVVPERMQIPPAASSPASPPPSSGRCARTRRIPDGRGPKSTSAWRGRIAPAARSGRTPGWAAESAGLDSVGTT